VSEPIAEALHQALEPLVRQIVKEELGRRDREWRWLTTEQTGELLGITVDAVRQRYWRKQLPGRKVEGRLYFDVADLDRLIREA
jgi:hypothetical protein